jgi:hypothetical protein
MQEEKSLSGDGIVLPAILSMVKHTQLLHVP